MFSLLFLNDISALNPIKWVRHVIICCFLLLVNYFRNSLREILENMTGLVMSYNVYLYSQYGYDLAQWGLFVGPIDL